MDAGTTGDGVGGLTVVAVATGVGTFTDGEGTSWMSVASVAAIGVVVFTGTGRAGEATR